MTTNDKPTVRSIDPGDLPRHHDAREAELRWDRTWDQTRIHHYDPTLPREETFVVDTPPPTVSGSLHIGHVFSYTHTDVIVRQRRMLGQNIFYPMGWDDNGLPTERRVQNLYHVRCEPHAPNEPDLELAPASARQRKSERPRIISRQRFIELCKRVTAEDERAFETLFRRIGLSVDWQQEYATIDDRSRSLAQHSFLDLHDKGHIYSLEAPTMWDVDFQTAVAQAEVEDRPRAGAFHDIEFGVEGSDRAFVISTTRPELLPACVAVTAHPDDERYRDLFGKRAVTPLFFAPVPIFPSELADPQKGTGILMVCTFGDATDVQWWREQGLPLCQILDRDGRLRAVRFGEPPFDSLRPDDASRAYAGLAGKSVSAARSAMVELLRDPATSATGRGAPLQAEPRTIQHAVRFYEKGERPLEFMTTRQWFVRLLDKKDALIEQGEAIGWHPDFMRLRYRNWAENLQLDWCISRQRYFGVPFPVWYRLDDQGRPLHDQVILADKGALPVDPMSDTPPGFDENQRDQPGGFTGEADVFDTWFTSSLTPQIGSRWLLDPDRHARLFPADIRPQSHEIIRTWAFYTIVKALLHDGRVPWHHVVISGWILDPDRKKMSKSVGNVITPVDLIDQYSADAVRYWAASARLGTDTAFDEKVLKIGKRLATKLFNAGKFVLAQSAELHPITHELDRAFLARLAEVIDQATQAFARFEYARALMDTEQFFWSSFTDTYLELAKARARGDVGDATARDATARGSAVATLRLSLDVLLRLFAPVLPYITEEIWSWTFAAERDQPSIHRAPWPSAKDITAPAPADPGLFALAVDCLATIHKKKTESGASVGRMIRRMTLCASQPTLTRLSPALDDILAAARCESHELVALPALDDGAFRVDALELADKKA